MVTIKVKDAWRCKSKMSVLSVGRIVIGEYHCKLRLNHDGFHRSNEGAVWDNSDKRMAKLEQAGDNPNRPLIFLGK